MNKDQCQKTIIGISGAIWITIVVYNVVTDFSSFSKATIAPMFQAALVVGISYYLVQSQTETRRLIELFSQLLGKSQDTFTLINQDVCRYIDMLCGTTADITCDCDTCRRRILSNSRKFRNSIEMIDQIPMSSKYKTEIESIREKWKEYNDLFSEISPNGRPAADLNSNAMRIGNLLDGQLDNLQIMVYLPKKRK